MRFTVFTHVAHVKHNDKLYAYRPYVTEMNIWFKYFDEIRVVAPLSKAHFTAIDAPYEHANITFVELKAFDFTSWTNLLAALFFLPFNLFIIAGEFQKKAHFHLRCPGNIGFLACIVQVFFPRKLKTAKYAGNWDPNSNQPKSYQWQRAILNSTFWSKNMRVLVYGDWPDNSTNIQPFFTATYSEQELLETTTNREESPIQFSFVGGITAGKNPFYALELIENLQQQGLACRLNFYGSGDLENALKQRISEKKLSFCELFGAVSKQNLKVAYQKSHFMILPSLSEGWPKAAAEAMFWACIPVITPVSCVPQMLDFGKRGILLTGDVSRDSVQLLALLQSGDMFAMSKAAQQWSISYTLESFENAIKAVVNHANITIN